MDAGLGPRGSRASRDRVAQPLGLFAQRLSVRFRPRFSRKTKANMPKSMDFSWSQGGRGLGRTVYVGDGFCCEESSPEDDIRWKPRGPFSLEKGSCLRAYAIEMAEVNGRWPR